MRALQLGLLIVHHVLLVVLLVLIATRDIARNNVRTQRVCRAKCSQDSPGSIYSVPELLFLRQAVGLCNTSSWARLLHGFSN